MISLSIDNSTATVASVPPAILSKLKEELSYEEPSYGLGGRRPQRRCLLSKKGSFPAGLVDRVQGLLRTLNAPVAVTDQRRKPASSPGMFTLNLGAIIPRDYQTAAVTAAAKKARAGLEMVTGSGKSLTMALLINELQMRTLVIVPSLALKQQLSETFLNVFGSLDNISVENIDSPRLQTMTNYDVLILDECHHAAASSYKALNRTAWRNIYHRYFFSGTFFRSKDSEQLVLEGIIGKLCFKFDYRAGLAAGAIVPIEAYYIEIPTQEYQGAETWASVYSKLVVKNEIRNDKILGLICSLRGAAGGPTLTLVKEIAHGAYLSEVSGVGFANGQDGLSRERILEFILGETKSLIGTTGVIGEGVDTKPAEYAILAAGGKAKTQFMQQVGRVLRLHPGKESGKVILVRDKSHRWLEQHFKAQVKILREEYGIVPIKLSV